MSPASDPPLHRSWLRFQFSLGTLFWLMLVVGIVIAWWKDRSSFDERLKMLEQIYAPTQQTLWEAGCVTEVIVIDKVGKETSIWIGTDPTTTATTTRTGLFAVPVPATMKSVQRVKIHVDSTGKGSWACLDAVGLTTAVGKTTWATSSDCSSVYGGGSLNAQTKKTTWHGLW